jgi:nifR3 family TIM-barrel protein
MAEDYIRSKGAIPAFKGYRGFPATLCISMNEEVVHGIPNQRRLKEGDIVSIDVGVNLNGYFGDAAVTLPVGVVDQAAQRLLGIVNVSFLDVNCACPAKKVIKKRSGAHLLRDTPRLYNILQRLIPALPLPITIKIRTGFDKKDDCHIVEMVKHCEDIGVSAIFVHGRLKTQGYAGDVDYGAIKKIKDAVHIPVFGSGNIFSGESAKLMFDETGCDGVMVARGGLGNPWIFKEIEGYIKTGKSPKEISLSEKKNTLKKHLDYIDKYKSISASGKAGFMRKVAIWYLKSIPGAPDLRARITRETKSCQDILKIVTEI